MSPIVQQHHIIIRKIVLAKIRPLFGHAEEALLIGESEKTCMRHKIATRIVRLFAAKSFPEEAIFVLLGNHTKLEFLLPKEKGSIYAVNLQKVDHCPKPLHCM